MSKIAFISDLHGNLPALEAVLKDIEKEQVSKIYCLGDLVGYYCYFNEVVELISNKGIHCILGNHDYALVYNDGIISTSKTCTKILKWQLERASNACMTFLRNLDTSMSFEFANRFIFAVHAGLQDHLHEDLFYVSDEYFKTNSFSQDILLTGHTHLNVHMSFFNGKMWFNPGSVGQPRDKNPNACYLIIDEDLNFKFKRIEYNYNKVITAMAKLGFDNYISKGLIDGTKIGS